MATRSYFGDTIGQAANAEERALERRLNLELANRSFLAQERARADAIAAQNAANAMRANELGLSLSQADRENATNLALALENQRYTRGLTDFQTQLGLQEKEKDRDLTRELNEVRQNQYQQRLAASDADQIYRDLAKRVDAGALPTLRDLSEAEGGRLGGEEYADLWNRLGTKQFQIHEEEQVGPVQAAAEANAALRRSALFETNPALAMNAVFRDLGKSRIYAGKIKPNYEALRFDPATDYRFSIGTDAMTPEQAALLSSRMAPPPPPVVPKPAPVPWYKRMLGLGGPPPPSAGAVSTNDLASRINPAIYPTVNVETAPSTNALQMSEQVAVDPRIRLIRYKLLIKQGYTPAQAKLMVNSRGPIRTY